MPTIANLREKIEENGFASRENILSPFEIDRLRAVLDQIDDHRTIQRRNTVRREGGLHPVVI